MNIRKNSKPSNFLITQYIKLDVPSQNELSFKLSRVFPDLYTKSTQWRNRRTILNENNEYN